MKVRPLTMLANRLERIDALVAEIALLSEESRVAARNLRTRRERDEVIHALDRVNEGIIGMAEETTACREAVAKAREWV